MKQSFGQKCRIDDHIVRDINPQPDHDDSADGACVLAGVGSSAMKRKFCPATITSGNCGNSIIHANISQD